MANLSHMHWRKLTKIKDEQKKAVKILLVGNEAPDPPYLVTITRVGPRKLDSDNLASACKYIRDQIAAWCNIDDGSDLYTWCYEQVKGPYRVDVEITTR